MDIPVPSVDDAIMNELLFSDIDLIELTRKYRTSFDLSNSAHNCQIMRPIFLRVIDHQIQPHKFIIMKIFGPTQDL